MRVSERMLFDSFVDHLQRQTESLFKIQEQVTSGKKVNRPSDDPINQAQILNYDGTLAVADQHLRNISHADALLTASESPLESVQDQLLRANELALQMANSLISPEHRANTAKEVRQIYDHLVGLANTTHNGQYIFAGDKTSTKPFVNQGQYLGTAVALPVTITAAVNDGLTITVDGLSATVTVAAGSYATGAQLASAVQTAINGDATFQAAGVSTSVQYGTNNLLITSNAVGGTSAVTPTGGTARAVLGLAAGTNQPAGTYLGDSAEIQTQIGVGATITKNLPGSRVFKGVGLSGGTDIFAAVGGLQSALESNNTAGIQAALTTLAAAQEQVSGELSVVGARMNRTAVTTAVLEDFRLIVSKLRSESGDADLTRAISELSLQQTALEATRAVAARVTQKSLLDFLR